jgi:hypothetical protein
VWKKLYERMAKSVATKKHGRREDLFCIFSFLLSKIHP